MLFSVGFFLPWASEVTESIMQFIFFFTGIYRFQLRISAHTNHKYTLDVARLTVQVNHRELAGLFNKGLKIRYQKHPLDSSQTSCDRGGVTT